MTKLRYYDLLEISASMKEKYDENRRKRQSEQRQDYKKLKTDHKNYKREMEY